MIKFWKRRPRYSEHIDYLLASIVYLGTNNKYWSRSPSKLAAELSLDQTKLVAAIEAFPGLFRKSKQPIEEEYPYSLQARYALIEGKDDYGDWHPPLTPETLRLLYDFVQKAADEERMAFRTTLTLALSTFAAVLSAAAVIYTATLKGSEAVLQEQIEQLRSTSMPSQTQNRVAAESAPRIRSSN